MWAFHSQEYGAYPTHEASDYARHLIVIYLNNIDLNKLTVHEREAGQRDKISGIILLR